MCSPYFIPFGVFLTSERSDIERIAKKEVFTIPRLKGLTEEQKKSHSDKEQCEYIRMILLNKLGRTPVYELANRVGMDATALSKRINGRTRWDVQTLTRVCDVLYISKETRGRMLSKEGNR